MFGPGSVAPASHPMIHFDFPAGIPLPTREVRDRFGRKSIAGRPRQNTFRIFTMYTPESIVWAQTRANPADHAGIGKKNPTGDPVRFLTWWSSENPNVGSREPESGNEKVLIRGAIDSIPEPDGCRPDEPLGHYRCTAGEFDELVSLTCPIGNLASHEDCGTADVAGKQFPKVSTLWRELLSVPKVEDDVRRWNGRKAPND